jgi:hypothetical protein
MATIVGQAGAVSGFSLTSDGATGTHVAYIAPPH